MVARSGGHRGAGRVRLLRYVSVGKRRGHEARPLQREARHQKEKKSRDKIQARNNNNNKKARKPHLQGAGIKNQKKREGKRERKHPEERERIQTTNHRSLARSSLSPPRRRPPLESCSLREGTDDK